MVVKRAVPVGEKAFPKRENALITGGFDKAVDHSAVELAGTVRTHRLAHNPTLDHVKGTAKDSAEKPRCDSAHKHAAGSLVLDEVATEQLLLDLIVT